MARKSQGAIPVVLRTRHASSRNLAVPMARTPTAMQRYICDTMHAQSGVQRLTLSESPAPSAGRFRMPRLGAERLLLMMAPEVCLVVVDIFCCVAGLAQAVVTCGVATGNRAVLRCCRSLSCSGGGRPGSTV